ncbi:MAG: hypothetical protein K6A65_06695 [Succinivibrionaceae bacterium]|nr:hypothetical protein [Succinivibrionaceae bacterium]
MAIKALPISAAGVLPFTFVESLDFTSLHEGGNGKAIKALRDALAGGAHALFLIHGPQGSGKSHVLQALHGLFTQDHGEGACLHLDLGGRAQGLLMPVMLGLGPLPLTLLDGVEAVAGDPEWEQALFALLNRWHDAGQGLVVAASRRTPDRMGFCRADLASRLAGGVTLPLEPITCLGECAEILIERARRRGVALPRRSAAYLVRQSHDLKELCALLPKLADAALASRHALTLPFIKGMLGL